MNKVSIEEKQIENLILDVFSRSKTKSMTEGSVEAVISMERDIAIYKAMADNILNGHMVAKYQGDPNKTMDSDKFLFKLTTEGEKTAKKTLKGKR